MKFYLRNLFCFGIAVCLLLGCAKKPKITQNTQIPTCQTQKYEIFLEQVDADEISQSFYSISDFRKLMESYFLQSNCFGLSTKYTQDSNDIFKASVVYGLKVAEQSEDVNLLKSKDEASLESFIEFALSSEQKIINHQSSGELKMSTDRYFGAKNVNKISKQEIERLLTQNLAFIIKKLQ